MTKRQYLVLFILLGIVISTGCSVKSKLTAPLAPGNLQAGQITTSSIAMIWEDHSDNENGFKIFRGTSPSKVTDNIANLGVGVTTFKDTGLTPDTTYYYQIRAFNTAGTSNPTNLLTAKTLAAATPPPATQEVPQTPTNLSVYSTEMTMITLHWEDQSDNENGFRTYLGTSPDNVTQLVGDVSANAIGILVTDLTPDTTYYFAVVAFNDAGESLRTNVVSGQTLSDQGQVTGRIVNQAGQGIAGMVVTIGSYQTVTDSAGNYQFTDIAPATYDIRAVGGTDQHYVFEDEYVQVRAGTNALGEGVAVQFYGLGVIIESLTNVQPQNLGAQAKLAFKESLFELATDSLNRRELSVLDSGVRREAMHLTPNSFTGILDHQAFIYLQWEAHPEMDNYVVELIQDGGRTVVWSSNFPGSGDPAFEPLAPEAYLDLTDELDGIITEPGIYQFQVHGSDNETGQIFSTPTISVSIGMLLDTYPTNIALTNAQVNWEAVNGADGYKVRLYNGNEGIYTEAVDTNSWTIPATAQDLLLTGTYYECNVDAQAYAETGWLAEITRGLSGFVW